MLRRRPAFAWSAMATVAAASGFLGVAANLAASLVQTARAEHLAAIQPVAIVLVLAGAMVLLAACANLATLSMSHYQARLGEFAIRACIGGTSPQLIRQLAIEGLVLATTACLAGGLFAFWSRQLMFAWLSPEQAAVVRGGMSAAATVAASLVSLLACAVVAFACARTAAGLGLPLLQAGGQDLAAAARGMRPRRRLVVAQVATACLLLVGATLLPHGMNRALATGPGTTAHEVVAIHAIAPDRYSDVAGGRRFQLAALERVAQLPGVTAVALTTTLPLVSASKTGFADSPHGEFTPYDTIVVSSGYFTTMQHPISLGSEFTARDDRIDGRVVINQQMADALFPRNPIGRHLYADDGKRMEVIGVVTNVRYRKMERPVAPTVYLPLSSRFLSGSHLVARTHGDARPHVAAIVEALRAIDNPRIERETTLDLHLRSAVRRDRIAMVFVAACGLLILLFAVSGPYLLTRQTETSRYDELAVRLACGARGKHIFGLVLAQAARATMAGIVLGATAALVGVVMLSEVTGVTAIDASRTTLVIGVVLLALSAIASAVPALRAYRLSPAAALR
jgi:predicted permease